MNEIEELQEQNDKNRTIMVSCKHIKSVQRSNDEYFICIV